MSYILEGLKKLEQKRQQEEKSPHLLTFQVNSTEKPAKPSLWFYILIAVLLLNAGAIIWGIHPWRSTGPNTPAGQSALRKSVPTVAKTIPVEQKKTTGKPFPAKGPQQSRVVSGPITSIAGKETKETPLPVVKETPVPKQTSVAAPASPPKSKPAADGRIIKLNELPPEIRNSLPDLKMSAHFYSVDQQARFARVNDKILHEGEALSEGLKVEEINPGGTIFNYRGYRFQIGINENR
jgi:general secretion pathway protein B